MARKPMRARMDRVSGTKVCQNGRLMVCQNGRHGVHDHTQREYQMIEVDRLTVKAAEALRAAIADAGRRRSAEVYGIHLLDALLRQEEGIVTPILDKIGVSAPAVGERVHAALDGLGRVSGGADARVSRDLGRALSAAERHAADLGDDYVSTEHLLLGLTVEKDDAGEILRSAGATEERVLEALSAVRGSHRVTDQTPEDRYQALSALQPRPDRAGAARQAGPGHRQGRRDSPRDQGARAPHQE